MIPKIKNLFSTAIGETEAFSLRKRIYHAASIIALLWLPFAFGVNLIISLPGVSIALTGVWIFFLILYLMSRYWNLSNLSLILFAIGCTTFVCINYFINSGLLGPSLILFILSVVLVLAVMPTRQFLIWLLINVLIVTSIVIFEYRNEEIIEITYSGRYDYFIDMLSTYIAVVCVIGAVLFFLVRNYNHEKNKAIQASKALENANNSKTRLFSVLSHDLRSPLNSITGYLETLNKYELTPQERQSLEQSLLDETKGMQVMLNNLLSWAKTQMEGGNTVNIVWLDLEQIVKECLVLQLNAAQRKGIQLTSNIDASLKVLADRDMLKLVITNLITNALKFTPQGGEVLIFAEQKDDFINIHIQDNGIGISKEKQGSLFTFSAGSTYGTNFEKGIGLGLVLCKEFVELQNGKIHFKSEPNQGTTFTLTFPQNV